MRNINVCIIGCFFLLSCQKKQVDAIHYNGYHYGDHPTWEYHTELHIHHDYDTLNYHRKVYTRASIKNPEYPIESQVIRALSRMDQFYIISDRIDFNWPGGDHLVVQKHDQGYEFSKNTAPSQLITPRDPNKLVLTSYGAAELFLTHTQLHPEFEKDVYLLQDSLRLFRIKVLDSSKNKQHDIALFSLDENNSGEARFLVNEKIVLKREYTVYEKSEGYQSKSIGYETKVDNSYNIEIDKIAYPNSGDYMEAAFQFLNQNKSPDKALEYIDQALELDYNWPSVRNKLIALDFLKKKKEASAFIDSFTKKELITMRQSYRVGRDLMQFQSQQQKADYTTVLYLFKQLSKSHPTEALPHFGIARAYSAQGHFEKAIKALQHSKQLDVEYQYTQQININLERLKQKKDML